MGLLLATVSGCGTLYLAQAARGQWQVMRQRQPIETVIANERTPADVRARLSEVIDAREFASRELGLPDNSSYRSYSDIRRPFVVWNVVAAPPFSVQPLRWCFPIAGCVAYRGYFNESRARDFALALRARGYDVTVGGVPAYSTLGHFPDPVLSSMLPYGDTALAAIVFHELAHQVVYVPGDSEFNEAFAVTVEQVGVERWLLSRGRDAELQAYRTQRARHSEFLALFTRGRAQLARLYSLKLAPQAMRNRKRMLLDGLTAEVRGLNRQQAGGRLYEAWLDEGLNNAHLASVATYFKCVPAFERLLADHGSDFKSFYDAVRERARGGKSVHNLCGAWAQDIESTQSVAGQKF